MKCMKRRLYAHFRLKRGRRMRIQKFPSFSGKGEQIRPTRFRQTSKKMDQKGQTNIGVSSSLSWRFSGIFPGFLLFGACFCPFWQVGELIINQKKNRWNLAGFQRFSLVQNGGRSRTRIYDLHDVNVAL